MDESSTTLRYLAMLEIIPRLPSQITVAEIIHELDLRGFSIDKRSVQRDLERLELPFKLTRQKIDGRQYGWSYSAKVLPRMLPSMDEHTALSFQLVKEYLQPLLPPESLKTIDPWFVMAGKSLASRKGDTARWQEKIFVLPSGPPRVPPRIGAAVQETIYHAVLHERPLIIRYLKPGAKESKEHAISPLGIIMRDHVVYFAAYLPATEKKMENVLYFAMHRTQDAKIAEEATFHRPKGFSLQIYAKEKLGFPMGTQKTLDLELRLDEWSAVSVRECPLSDKQNMVASGDGFLLTATVQNTHEIRQWIRSMGKGVEVLEPGFLLAEIKDEVAALSNLYRVSSKAR